MSSVLMTSTMKSEPLRASVSGVAGGSTFSLGGTGVTLDARGAGVCAAAFPAAAARPSAGAAATAPARNWRRFILGGLDTAASIYLRPLERTCHPRVPNPSELAKILVSPATVLANWLQAASKTAGAPP